MNKKDIEVYQSNSFVESRQAYTVNEKRLLSTIIGFVKPTDTEFSEYQISIKDWAKMLKVSPKGLYQISDELTTGLMMKIVSIKDPEKLKFEKWHVLDTAMYEDGILTLKLDKRMNDIFLQLRATKNYTHYELMEFVTLTSTHAQRIYELLKQYQHSKYRNRKILIADLKMMLGIEDKYQKFADFRKYVLEVAEKQIHESTTLRYKWKPSKRGRSYDKIEFYEIHISGKESPSELQERAYLDGYIGEEIYCEEFNTYLTIKEVLKNKDKTYMVIDKFDGAEYGYASREMLQRGLVKAQMQKGLL